MCNFAGFRIWQRSNQHRRAQTAPSSPSWVSRTKPVSTLVVYVHGLWLTGNEAGILLRRLARELNAKTRAFSYPSMTSNISDSAQALGKFLTQQRAETLHLVGHSLGGLVILKLFESGKGAQLPPGRI